MILAIAGSRQISIDSIRLHQLWVELEPKEAITIIAHGGSGMVDLAASNLSARLAIPMRVFHPAWGEYGKPAGPMRNEEMSVYADQLLALWDGESPGTLDVIKRFRKKEKPAHVYLWQKKRFLLPDESLVPVEPTQNDEPSSSSS